MSFTLFATDGEDSKQNMFPNSKASSQPLLRRLESLSSREISRNRIFGFLANTNARTPARPDRAPVARFVGCCFHFLKRWSGGVPFNCEALYAILEVIPESNSRFDFTLGGLDALANIRTAEQEGESREVASGRTTTSHNFPDC